MNRPQEVFPPIRKLDDTWARSDEDKVELFAHHLSNVFKPNPQSGLDNDAVIDEVLQYDLQLSLPLKPITPREVIREFLKLDAKKAPGFDLITAEILRQLPRKAVVFVTILMNGILRTSYIPKLWKVSQIKMVPKPKKPLELVTSYRPISLLPVLSKVCERLILSRLQPILDQNCVIPNHQFGFRREHATLEQVHRVCNAIRQGLEKKEYCSAAFLDIQQAFDRVWHKGLLYKIKTLLPHSFYLLMESYLKDRIFQVGMRDARSNFFKCEAGIPQGSVMGPVLYCIYTSDLPQTDGVLVATFADDTAMIATSTNAAEASNNLQHQLNMTNKWLSEWRIKASANKSVHITFALRHGDCPGVTLGDEALPHTNTVKYLGFHLDRRLTWKDHVKAKRHELNIRSKNLHWLIGRNSPLKLENKLLVYKSILKPIWTYGLQLWGTASHSNIEILQRAQNNILRMLSNAPWFSRTSEIHEYLEIPTIIQELKQCSSMYKDRLRHHPNQLAIDLLETSGIVNRLKRSVFLQATN